MWICDRGETRFTIRQHTPKTPVEVGRSSPGSVVESNLITSQRCDRPAASDPEGGMALMDFFACTAPTVLRGGLAPSPILLCDMNVEIDRLMDPASSRAVSYFESVTVTVCPFLGAVSARRPRGIGIVICTPNLLFLHLLLDNHSTPRYRSKYRLYTHYMRQTVSTIQAK